MKIKIIFFFFTQVLQLCTTLWKNNIIKFFSDPDDPSPSTPQPSLTYPQLQYGPSGSGKFTSKHNKKVKVRKAATNYYLVGQTKPIITQKDRYTFIGIVCCSNKTYWALWYALLLVGRIFFFFCDFPIIKSVVINGEMNIRNTSLLFHFYQRRLNYSVESVWSF